MGAASTANEPDAVRHFVNLSQLNHAVDTGFYPLGSCTMKWNPKVNEWAARLPGFAQLHPMAPDAVAQAWNRIQFTSDVSLDLVAKSVQDGKDAGFLKGSTDTSKLVETP